MKTKYILLLPVLLLVVSCGGKGKSKSKYTYETFKNDPIKTQLYTLKNGLKVYMSVNKDAPRISTSIAVRTGSKNDPSDATGLAHYLEHMLFKGSNHYGTLDYEKELPMLTRIEELYETYRTKTDPEERRSIYAQIDSVSQEASKLAVANEYDKMMQDMGATGTNAFTSFEQTVYINDIPSNQLKRWVELEADRFQMPVFRLFHTELEAVYEEKNISLDSDGDKVIETILAKLFQNHNYGKQTTIGTVEHLKNPSLKKIREYFNTYYVPNNMAIILTGDFDPDSAVTWIEKHFSGFQPKEVPKYAYDAEPKTAPQTLTILGPEEESVNIGFRFGGLHSDDAIKLELADMILSNSTAGLIDLNLLQEQKVLNAYSTCWVLKDYSMEYFSANPKEGQTLEQAKDLMFAQIDSLKKGAFPDWLIGAIVKDLKKSRIANLDDNWGRNYEIQEVFINELQYEDYVNRIEKMEKLTKADIVKFANEKFTDNYVIVYKKTGEDPNVVKVDKPKITPLEIKRDTMSTFMKHIVDQPVSPIEPVFVDFQKEVSETKIQEGLNLYYYQNKSNDLFELTYLINLGSKTDRILPVAIKYLDFLGTDKYNPVELKQEFYKIGCSFAVFPSSDRVFITLSGMQEDFESGLKLFEHLLDNAQPNPDALQNLISDIQKQRSDDKLNKSNILWSGLMNYGKYGADNPFTYKLSNAELAQLVDSILIQSIKKMKTYEHRVLYFGPAKDADISGLLKKYHTVPQQLAPVPTERTYTEQNTENKVFIVNYDMQQAEIILLSKDIIFDQQFMPISSLYNEYFGGGMSSVVFQEIRESKAYAYSAFSTYSQPNKPGLSYYLFSYLGTQADKMPEAIYAMTSLLDSMPKSEKNLETCKKNILEKIRTERIVKSNVLWTYEYNKRMGFDHDMRKDVFELVPKFTFADLEKFHKEHVHGKNKFILIVGNKKKLNMKELQKYGPITELTLEQVFGY